MSRQQKYFHKYFKVQKGVVVLLQLVGTRFIWAAMGEGAVGHAGQGEGYLTRHFSNLCETRGTLN